MGPGPIWARQTAVAPNWHSSPEFSHRAGQQKLFFLILGFPLPLFPLESLKGPVYGYYISSSWVWSVLPTSPWRCTAPGFVPVRIFLPPDVAEREGASGARSNAWDNLTLPPYRKNHKKNNGSDPGPKIMLQTPGWSQNTPTGSGIILPTRGTHSEKIMFLYFLGPSCPAGSLGPSHP